MKKLVVILSFFLISCNQHEIKLIEIADEEFNFERFYPENTDTLWISENKEIKHIRKQLRNESEDFIVTENYYKVDCGNYNWIIENDSFIVYHDGLPFEIWKKFEGDYNGIWSDLNCNWSRLMKTINKPDSIKWKPTKPGIYKVETSQKFTKVDKTNISGLYYYTRFPYGIIEKISVKDLITKTE